MYSLGAVSLFFILAAQARADFESAVAQLEAVSRVLDLDEQTVHRRQVRVGWLLPDGLQVLDGLEGGEHLVVRGVHRLEEGQKVRLLNVSVPSDSRPSSNGRGMP